MEVLKGDDQQVLWELLWEAFPGHLLLYIATGEGCRRNQIHSEAARWFPLNSRDDSVHEQVSRILEWFELRGDIIRGAENRYRCVPPYILCGPKGSSSQAVPLFGNPLVEKKLDGVLQGCADVRKEIVWENYGPEESQPNLPRVPVGVERVLRFQVASGPDLLGRLQAIGMTILNPADLREALPNITDLTWPGIGAFGPPPIFPGVWEVYDPSVARPYYQAGRWRPEPQWQGGIHRLLRWAPGTEYSYGNRRYFLHAQGRVLEISRDEAQWWQFRLDAEEGNVTTWYVCEATNELWVNGRLPRVIAQWLRFFASRPPKRSRYWNIFPLLPDQWDEVRTVAHENLGVRWETRNQRPVSQGE